MNVYSPHVQMEKNQLSKISTLCLQNVDMIKRSIFICENDLQLESNSKDY